MNANLLPNVHDPSITKMQNWKRIHDSIDKIANKTDYISKLGRANSSTHMKIVFADYHFHVLNQAYIPKITRAFPESPIWALAELNSIVMNLYSGLDSLANEINLLYNFGIDSRNVEVYHNTAEHSSKYNKNCVRCQVTAFDPTLSNFLEHELNQSWFLDFRETRKQLVHRDQPIYNFTVSIGDPDFPEETTVLLLPNQPFIENPQMNDYSQGFDFNTYSQECRLNVVPFIEHTYKMLEPKFLSLKP